MKRKPQNKLIKAVIVLVLISILIIAVNFEKVISSMAIFEKKSEKGVFVPVNVTKENLPSYLMSSSMIKDMPKKANVRLKLYDDSQGERKWEEIYFINENSVKEVSSDDNEKVDVEIYLDSNYISELGLRELCSSIKKAKVNGKLGTELKISKVSFLWKYREMMKYKDCL